MSRYRTKKYRRWHNRYVSKNRRRINRQAREWGVKFSDRKRDYFYQQKYGISLSRYNEMYARQVGRCALCNRPFRRLCVDHNHTTKVVRELLCRNCNTMIGMSGESPELLVRGTEYLHRHSLIQVSGLGAGPSKEKE